MSPLFWPNRYFKKYLGTALYGLCLSSSIFGQTSPLTPPSSTSYPGILQSFEKIIKVDADKFKNKSDALIKNGKVFSDSTAVTQLDLDPDFLNSIILHSEPGYIKLASTDKCRFYDTILTDLLKSTEGKINNVIVTYLNKSSVRETSIINKKDFLAKVVNIECPETQNLINKFQIKNLDQTLRETPFDVPTGKDQCRNIHLGWLNNPKTPYLCQIHEYMKETKNGVGNPKDLQQRQAIGKILDQKLSMIQKDYLENLCPNLDAEELFCEDFLNVSFWNKVAGGFEDKIFAQDICAGVVGITKPNDPQFKQCLARLKKENDLCLYPSGRNSSLTPAPQCDTLSTALNFSSLRSNYQDCPGQSDQYAATNLARVFLHLSKENIQPFEGSCAVISSGVTLDFNKRFDNEENWKLEACYEDRMNEKEVCYKTYFGKYGNQPEAYTNVVATILKNTRGAESNLKCAMVDSQDYNPLLLQYKSGCYIIYERNKCYSSECKHRILYNDRVVDFIKIKNRLTMDYFATSVKEERFSQHYLLSRDYKKNARSLSNLTSLMGFFKKNQNGIVHGIGCAEDILPSFFKKKKMNQCSPLPFIIDGVIREGDKVSFVTRTAVDSLQAPRLVSWSYIYSTVKAYQRLHPLKIWTLYGLD